MTADLNFFHSFLNLGTRVETKINFLLHKKVAKRSEKDAKKTLSWQD
jgi:hypothetical protein